MTASSDLGRPLRIFAVFAVFIAALASHALCVRNYGIDIPIWDQWGAEGLFLLKPWAEGHLAWSDLIAPWNEHRIAPTRVLALAMYELSNGSWSPLRTQYVNAAIYALIPASIVLLTARSDAGRKQKIMFALFVLVLSVIPYAWENTLGGFQNQFYFLLLALIIGLGMAAFCRFGAASAIGILATAALGVFTMAPGIMTAPAIAAVVLARAWLGQIGWRKALIITTVLVSIFIAGYAATPVINANLAQRAQSARDLYHAFVLTIGWPMTSRRTGGILLWLPTMVACWMVFRRRWSGNLDLFMLGLSAWTIVQALGIAIARGHDMTAVTPRYDDVLAMGLFSNFWFAIRLATWPQKSGICTIAGRIPASLLALTIAEGFISGDAVYLRDMAERRNQLLMQRTHVQAYLRHGQAAELNQAVPAIGLPDPASLRMVLDDPTIRRMLRAPLGISAPPQTDPDASSN